MYPTTSLHATHHRRNGAAPATAEPIILVEDVRKSFPAAYGIVPWLKTLGRIPRRDVLRGITLTVCRGELLGILGPNGAGKTTLLKALATLLLPDRGRIIIDGVDVQSDPIAAKRKVGFCISEERSFYFRLTARANLEFFAALCGLHGAAMRRRIEEVAEIVDLANALDQRFSSFSSGMRQRMTIARAMLSDPTIIVLDEPTRGVDPVHAEEIRCFIREHLIERLGKTVILATNLLDEAWRLCDRIAVLNGGVIVAFGPPGALDGALQRADRIVITVDRVEERLLARIAAIGGVTVTAIAEEAAGESVHVDIADNPDALAALCSVLSVSETTVRGFTTIPPSPADVFQRVTKTNG